MITGGCCSTSFDCFTGLRFLSGGVGFSLSIFVLGNGIGFALGRTVLGLGAGLFRST